MNQISFIDAEYSLKKRKTRREKLSVNNLFFTPPGPEAGFSLQNG